MCYCILICVVGIKPMLRPSDRFHLLTGKWMPSVIYLPYKSLSGAKNAILWEPPLTLTWQYLLFEWSHLLITCKSVIMKSQTTDLQLLSSKTQGIPWFPRGHCDGLQGGVPTSQHKERQVLGKYTTPTLSCSHGRHHSSVENILFYWT